MTLPTEFEYHGHAMLQQELDSDTLSTLSAAFSVMVHQLAKELGLVTPLLSATVTGVDMSDGTTMAVFTILKLRVH